MDEVAAARSFYRPSVEVIHSLFIHISNSYNWVVESTACTLIYNFTLIFKCIISVNKMISVLRWDFLILCQYKKMGIKGL